MGQLHHLRALSCVKQETDFMCVHLMWFKVTLKFNIYLQSISSYSLQISSIALLSLFVRIVVKIKHTLVAMTY